MRIKAILLFVMFCLSNITLQAQNDTISKSKLNAEFATYSLGWSASALANFFPAIQLSHDFRIAEKWNASLETAYIFGSTYSDNASGFRLKPGIQYGFSDNSGSVYFLVGLHANIRYSKSARDVFENYPEQSFYEIKRTIRSKLLIGGEFYLGFRIALMERLNIEIGSGLGYGYFFVEDSEITQNTFNEFGSFFSLYDVPGQYPFLIVSPHLNFSYDIVK